MKENGVEETGEREREEVERDEGKEGRRKEGRRNIRKGEGISEAKGTNKLTSKLEGCRILQT